MVEAAEEELFTVTKDGNTGSRVALGMVVLVQDTHAVFDYMTGNE